MNKNRIAGMLITAVTLLIVAGVLLGIDIWKKEGNVKQVTLTVDGETRESLSVSLTDFYPGETREYVVNLICRDEGSYEVAVKFEKKGDGNLDEYITAEIETQGTRAGGKTLKEYFKGETLTRTCEAKAEEEINLAIRYAMPSAVGNEAQKASCGFDVVITVIRK